MDIEESHPMFVTNSMTVMQSIDGGGQGWREGNH